MPDRACPGLVPGCRHHLCERVILSGVRKVAELAEAPKRTKSKNLKALKTVAINAAVFLLWRGSVGLKSQPLSSIMPARKRSVAMLALCGCPLVRTSLLPPPLFWRFLIEIEHLSVFLRRSEVLFHISVKIMYI